MSRPKGKRLCKLCGRAETEDHHLTERSYCLECGITVSIGVVRQLAAKSGPAYDKWRKAVLESALKENGVGVVYIPQSDVPPHST